jgi:hypothetical protein
MLFVDELNKNELADEERIVWEEDISGLDYVREVVCEAGTRQRPVPWHKHEVGRRVGYAVLKSDAKNTGCPGEFYRRLFFLKDHDRDREPNGVYSWTAPFEAVDPRTVRPGCPGELAERAWGGTLPKNLIRRIGQYGGGWRRFTRSRGRRMCETRCENFSTHPQAPNGWGRFWPTGWVLAFCIKRGWCNK